MKNYYQILQVSENASSEVIEKAYKVLAKKYHPDLQSGDTKSRLAEGVFKEITEAYEILSDKVLREQYDKQIGLIPNYNNFTYTKPNTESDSQTTKSSSKSKKIQKQTELEKFSIKNLVTIISNAIRNQANKPKDERRRDLIALILTLIVVAILVVIVLNVPVLKNFFF